MTDRSDYVSIEIDDQRIDEWTEYRADSDLLVPADSFTATFEVGAERGAAMRDAFQRIRRACVKNASVKLYIGADIHGGDRTRALQLTGILDEPEVDSSKTNGTVIRISGRDRAAHLVDSAVPVGVVRALGDEAMFVDLAREVVRPWNIEVISDASAARFVRTGAAGLTPEDRLRVEQARAQGIPAAFMTQHILREAQRAQRPVDEFTGAPVDERARGRSANGMVGSDIERLTVAEASPRAGETVWSFLARHAERLRVMMWFSPDGKLILGSPDYSQTPRYRFVRRWTSDPGDPNNYEEGGTKWNGADQLSKVTVYGRAHGHDVTRSRIRAVATNLDMPFERRKIEHLGDCTSQAQADAAAKRLIREGEESAEVTTIQADDHGQGRYLYAADATADVLDEVSEIDGPRYITSRSFARSRTGGTHTNLRLVPLNSLTL